MCLGVPMRIKEINGFNARCEARGIERNASLFLLQHEEVQVGDMVMILSLIHISEPTRH